MIGFRSLLVTMAVLPSMAVAAPAADPVAAWSNTVEARIARAIRPPVDDRTGQVTVTFRRGADGNAERVEATGGSASLRRAALLTAGRLHGLPPLPAGLAADTPVVMQLLFGEAGGETAFIGDQTAMRRHAARRNAQLAQRLSETQLAFAAPAR